MSENQLTDDTLTIAGRAFTSRLIIGTGKYADYAENAAAAEAAGAEIVTVAVRRVNLTDPNAPMLADFIDPQKFTYLPNTRVVLLAKMRCGHCDWRARQAAGRWSNLKCWAMKKPYPNMPETCARRNC